MPVLIADISDFQQPLNPAAYKSVGITGIITKVTESNYFATRTHAHNLQAARDAGMIVGAYHFAHLRDAGQADWYLDHVERAWGGHDGLLHMLDVEQEAGGKNPDIKDVQDFANRFYARTNNHPLLVYSGNWYWRGTIGNPQNNVGSGLVDANYVRGGGDPRQIVKAVTPGYWRPYGTWKTPLLRQFTSSAVVPGEPFPVDCSVLYGTEADLKTYLRPCGPPQPPPWQDRPTLSEGAGMPPAAPNADVRFLQASLNTLHTRVLLTVDGRFGPGTASAVRDFQGFIRTKDATVIVDGIVGPKTWAGIHFFLVLAGQA